MKKYILAFSFFLLFQTGFRSGKSYSVEGIQIGAQVLPDGSLTIEEKIQYSFDGSFSFAYREIPIRPGERIENIQVSEGTNGYFPSENKEEGSYQVTDSDDQIKLTWYFRAEDEPREFTVRYSLKGVIKRYPDTAELYYKFVGEGWEEPIQQVSVRVQLLNDVPADSIRAWAHGPLHGTVEIPGDGTVVLNVAPLPKKTFWEGRILFDDAGLTGLALHSDTPAMESILAEEAAWAKEANRQREQEIEDAARRKELAGIWLPAMILMPLLGASVWILLFLKFGKPYPVKRSFVPGEKPSEHPPAFIDYLLSHQVTGGSIITTLIDLAHRGHLKISEKVRVKSGWLGTKEEMDYRFERTGQTAGELADFEKALLDFILKQAGDPTGFYLSEFKKVSRKKHSEFLKWFKSWRKDLESLVKKEKFFEPYRLGVLLFNILFGVIVFASGITYFAVTKSQLFGLPIVIGLMQVILSFALARRTEKGQHLFKAWKGYKKHLKSTLKAKGPVSLTSAEWGQSIVAAVLFGLHKEIGKAMEKSLGANNQPVIPWYAIARGGERSAGVGGIGNGFSSMVTSVSTAMSSASGMGGGASGGGGGGSGGGGGGAG